MSFGACRFEPHGNKLARGGEQYRLEPKQSQVLLWLLAHAGDVVTKDDLLAFCWQGRPVPDEVLTVAVSHLRKALGDSARNPIYIKTVPGTGYQFVGPVAASQRRAAQHLVTPTQTVAPGLRERPFWQAPAFVGAAIVLLLVGFFMAGSLQEDSDDRLREANALLQTGDAADARQALDLFESVRTADPENAAAWVGLASARFTLLRERPAVLHTAYEEIMTLLDRAIALDPEAAPPHHLKARVQFLSGWDAAAAEASFARAFALDDAHAWRYLEYAQMRLALGDFEGAEQAIRRSRELDADIYASPIVVWIYNMQRRYADAELELEKLLTLRPDTLDYHVSAQALFENIGNEARSFEHLIRVLELSDFAATEVDSVRASFRQDGLRGAYRWLAENGNGRDIGQYQTPLSLARYHAVDGEVTRALDLLEAAVAARQVELLWLGVDPKYDRLREHPRFQAVLDEIGMNAPVRRQVLAQAQ